jgi:translocation and assembly module TamB
VKGDRFLNVFSPAFKGEVSAGLQLLGTLREPIAVGAVTVDSGKVLFPFGTLQIASGRVDLTREDPYRPRLEFRAEGRNYGYTVTVDLRGPMDAPNLTFQSVPPLNAQQILLMLTAGEIPRSDFGYDATDKAGQVGYYIGKEFVNRFIGNTSTTERLILKSGEDVTNEGKTTYSIEYLFTDRWSVFGEYDRFQNVNSGLKFKVLSK